MRHRQRPGDIITPEINYITVKCICDRICENPPLTHIRFFGFSETVASVHVRSDEMILLLREVG